MSNSNAQWVRVQRCSVRAAIRQRKADRAATLAKMPVREQVSFEQHFADRAHRAADLTAAVPEEYEAGLWAESEMCSQLSLAFGR